jgi:hypothetical protein
VTPDRSNAGGAAAEPRRLTGVERGWLALLALLAVELVSLALPRARVDSYEGFFSTYYGADVPRSAGTIDVEGFFFAAPAAIEVALMGVVAIVATALALRRDRAALLRRPALIAAVALPGWTALAVLVPGVDEGVPFTVLAGGWVGLTAAVAAGVVLAAMALAGDRAAPATPKDE